MDTNETMVEQDTAQATDDALQETELVEETDESEDETVESILEDENQPEAKKEEPPKQEPQASEPGWIRKRVDKAVQKAVAETEARMQALFDRQMAPIREKMMDTEAQELVQKGIVKDLATAKELVRYRQGQAPVQAPQAAQQPRNEKGQFQPKDDPVISARVDMLAHQADTIREKRGLDVIDEFNNNPEIKQRVISGELDFYDVAEIMAKSAPKKRAPAPVRSPNGASGYQATPISTMTDEQFEKLEKRIQAGARITLK